MVWQQRYEFWNGLKLINQNDVPVLGLAGCHRWRNWKLAGTSMSVPIDITDDTLASSLVPVQCASLAPPAKKETENWISGCTTQNAEWIEVLHLFRCFTHTVRMKEDGGEMKIKLKWKLLNRDPERGNATKERRNQEKTPTPTHLARSGQTLKRQGKRKTEADGRTDPDPRKGGKDGSAWTNLHRRNKAYLSTQGPNLPGERSTHEIRDQWGLADQV